MVSIEDYIKNFESVNEINPVEELRKFEKLAEEKNQKRAVIVRKNTKECFDKLTAVVLNPPSKKDVKFGEVMRDDVDFYFGYSHILGSIQFFTPKIEEKYFNPKEFFAKYLRENGWNLIVFRHKDSYRVVSGICQIFPQKMENLYVGIAIVISVSKPKQKFTTLDFL